MNLLKAAGGSSHIAASLGVWMRDRLGVCYDANGPFDEAWARRSVGAVGERGISFETLAQHHLGRETFEHALTATVLGRVEAAQHDL